MDVHKSNERYKNTRIITMQITVMLSTDKKKRKKKGYLQVTHEWKLAPHSEE